MDIGYVPNSSGHIGQMPQLLSGFGIVDAVVISGVGNAPVELWWEAPDGSEVLLHRGRCQGPAELLDVGGDVDRDHALERQPPRAGPVEEAKRVSVVGLSGVRVSDVCGEELDEPLARHSRSRVVWWKWRVASGE